MINKSVAYRQQYEGWMRLSGTFSLIPALTRYLRNPCCAAIDSYRQNYISKSRNNPPLPPHAENNKTPVFLYLCLHIGITCRYDCSYSQISVTFISSLFARHKQHKNLRVICSISDNRTLQ